MAGAADGTLLSELTYPRRIAVSISHSTRCLDVASRLTETGLTLLDPG